MLFKCIICRDPFDSITAKPEHILLNALGGKKTTYKVVCSDCNEKAGQTIDAALAKSVERIRNFCNWKSGDGDDAPTLIAVECNDGTKINLLPGGVPDDRKVEFHVDSSKEGSLSFKGGITGYERLVAMIPHIAKRLGISEDQVLEEMTKNGLNINVRRPPIVNATLNLGGTEQSASAKKMVFVLWCELIGNKAATSTFYDAAANHIHEQIKIRSLPADHFPDGRIPLGLKLPESRQWGQNPSIIHVFSDSNGRVCGWFRLYNTINFFSELGTDSENRSRSITLISNPDTLESEIAIDFDLGVSRDFFINFPDQPVEIQSAVERLMSYVYKEHEEINRNKIISESVDEVFPSNGELLPEHLDEICSRIVIGLMAQKKDFNYDKALKILTDIQKKKINKKSYIKV